MLKYALTRIGEHLSMESIRRANAVVNYLELGRWMRAHNQRPARLRRREQIYDRIATQVKDSKVLYLEFGVWRGASLRYWSSILPNPESHLHGFDTFEGLPEDWQHNVKKGTFSTDGQMPSFTDSRVRLFKGLFQHTLADYELPPHDVMVVNLDADLYSSTIFVLETLGHTLRPGDYLIFDEFSDRLHELRAFDEFLSSSKIGVSAVWATTSLNQVAFRCSGFKTPGTHSPA